MKHEEKRELELISKLLQTHQIQFVADTSYTPQRLQAQLKSVLSDFVNQKLNYCEFGKEFKALIKERGFSAKGIATRCGITDTYLCYIVHGKRKLQPGLAVLIARELSLPDNYFDKYLVP